MRRVAVLVACLAAVLAGSPARAADPLPVPYQFIPSALLGGAPDADALAKVAELHRRGDLSDEEFTAAKRDIIGG